MHIASTIALSAAALLGCAGTAQNGSFIVGQPAAQAALAADAASKLAQDYGPRAEEGDGEQRDAPAQPIVVKHPARDPFGRALCSELRSLGFAVREHSIGAGREAPARNDSAQGAATGALPLSYVIDRLKHTALLRVTLGLGARRLSRAYALDTDGARPVGPWSSTRRAGGVP